jgi:PA14 domain-containing protein
LQGKRTRIDPVIDFSGREFDDDVKRFELTIKWTGAISAPVPGHYTVYATTSDAVRVRLDNKTVIDTFATRGARRDAQVVLGERPVPLVVEFVATNTEQHRLRLMWKPAAKPAVEPIPAEHLFHDKRGEPALAKSAP